MFVALFKKQGVETLKKLENFQMMKKASFIMDQNKNSSDYRREATLTLLHTKYFHNSLRYLLLLHTRDLKVKSFLW